LQVGNYKISQDSHHGRQKAFGVPENRVQFFSSNPCP
jgi:hypothetical protein